MNEVLHGVGGVNALIGQIALASEEQSKGIAQVTLAVAELDRVTQQNATLVQEVSATAANLSGQTTALGGAITRFTLPEESGKTTVSPPARPPQVRVNIPVTPSQKSDWVAFGHH